MNSSTKGFAIVLSVLIVASMTVPFVGLAGAQSLDVDGSNTTASDDAEGESDLPPRLKKAQAIEVIEGIDTGDLGWHGIYAERAREQINRTLDDYADQVRITDRSVFTRDAIALRVLMRLDGTDASEDARRAAVLIYEADNRSTRVAVADARRVLNQYGEELNRGQRRAAERRLRAAERALDRADRVAEYDGDYRRFDRSRVAALRHLRIASRLADSVLALADRSVEPTVTIDRRADPIRNGNDTTRYVVTGNVSAVNPTAISKVTVTVNDDWTVEANVTAGARTPGANLSYAVVVNLTQRTNRIEVTVDADSQDDEHNRGRGRKRGQGRNRGGDADTSESAMAVLRLDGDGLSDRNETAITGTDPLDPDSDATDTEGDEADNGTIDGQEDFDGDGLITLRELAVGTDPMDDDTDGDGLNDRSELTMTRTDPTTADSNGDGTNDGAEDPDGDGLTNTREVAAGSDPRQSDGDADGFSDPQELENGTGPLDPDTDDDELADGVEPSLETDPLDPDADGDGTLDGNETFKRTVSEDETGVNVVLRGEGAVAAEITPKPTYSGDTNASAGPTVRIENETEIDNATVRLPIDDSVAESEYDDLSVYKWDGTTEGRWHPIDTTIENGTAVASVSSFSFFTVLDTDEWTSYAEGSSNDTNASPLAFSNLSEFWCANSCTVSNGTTLVLGGEPNARKITIEQGNESFEVVPLSNGQTIEEFYNYGENEINSPLPVAKSDVSRLFFWSGPNGLSLMVIHDKPRDGSGGAVSMDFTNLPTREGYWIVEDDPGDFESSTDVTPDWSWTADNTDGGVFRGGLTNSTITITPSFNDGAARRPLTPGTIDRWQVATGRATDPRNISLDMTEPVTIDFPETPDTDTDGGETGDQGSAFFTRSIAPETRNVVVTYQTEQTNVDPTAVFTVTGTNGTTVTERLNIGTVGTVQETINVSKLSGEVAFSVNVSGVDARLQVVPDRTRRNTDGDGLSDARERRTWVMANGPRDTFSTSPTKADTDGDGLNDSEEVRFSARENTSGGFVVNTTSNPTVADTDGDGLADPTELTGWDVPVVTRNGEPYRYATDSAAANGTANFSSNPLTVDPDGDNLNDTAEKERTNTDPESEQTYGITADHEELLDRMDPEDWGSVFPGTTIRGTDSIDLTDASDDFDFVVPEAEGTNEDVTFGLYADVAFTALDGTPRTDTWLPNEAEVENDTGVWDPDTDNDGLTDGQELAYVTKAPEPREGTPRGGLPAKLYPVRVDDDATYNTDPLDPDSDGDGYWDGWFGVYGVETTDDVVLYREHLRNNITGDERVSEQLGYHELSGSKISSVGYDIDDDGVDEHSNLHIGELKWRTDPTDDLGNDGVPQTEVQLEVDFFEGSDSDLKTTGWRERLERNYRLYSIELDVRYDDRNVMKNELGNTYCNIGTKQLCRYYTTPFGADDIVFIDNNLKSLGTDIYLFVGDRAADSSVSSIIRPGQTGVSAKFPPGLNIVDTTVIFTDPHQNAFNTVPTDSILAATRRCARSQPKQPSTRSAIN